MMLCQTSRRRDLNLTDTPNNNEQIGRIPLKILYPNIPVIRTSSRDLPCPNRTKYESKYCSFVSSSISDFKAKCPGKLREYRDMTLEEKAVEQQQVLALLTKLGISKVGPNERSTALRLKASYTPQKKSFETPTPTDRKRLLDETLSPAFTPELSNQREKWTTQLSLSENAQFDKSMAEAECSNIECEQSEILLSMDGDAKEKEMHDIFDEIHQDTLEQSTEFSIRDDKDDDDSVEHVRRAEDRISSDDDSSTVTPEGQIIDKSGIKRVASHSGKRGMDQQRKRLNVHDNEYVDNLSRHLGRLSMSPSATSTPPEEIFTSSQSPISPKLTAQTSLSSPREHGISFGEDCDDSVDRRHRIANRESSRGECDSIANSTNQGGFENQRSAGRYSRKVPLDLSLKEGVAFHLGKLSVKRTEKDLQRAKWPLKSRATTVNQRRLVNFPDPFTRYSSRQKRGMEEIYSWIRQAENDQQDGSVAVTAAGVFFSLSEKQIIDISLKLLLRDLSHNLNHHRLGESSEYLKGNTLVVVRSKDDAVEWERALRESTGCSFCNHASLPLTERIRPSSSEKLCAHDVVLTTYDAMKAPDVTIPLNDEGHAVVTKISSDSGWHSSRTISQTMSQHNPSPQPTKQLSILHRIQFRRVIFVDVLGRKSYLAKGGTARATAAIAINGETRAVFFQQSEADGSNPLWALRKSDKKAVSSVSSVLRLTTDDDDTEDDSDNEGDGDGPKQSSLESLVVDFRELC
jgi:hypothetical protein